jgi:peptidyl-prolyl cis-trans isomerase C
MHFITGFVAVAALTVVLAGSGIASAADAVPPKEPAATAKPVEQSAPAKAAAPAAKPSDIVVTVNGVAITRAELDRSVQVLLSQNRMQAPTDPEQKKKLEEAALNQIVAAELLYQNGKKLEIPDLDKKIDEKYAQGKSRFPTKEEFEKALKDNGITEKELKELIRRDVVVSNYIEKQVSSKITITTEQARKFYDENLDKFKKPESTRASHILVGVDPKATAEEKQKAKQKADDLLKQVKGGADFAELAKKESTCPSSKNGGDLGEFGRGQMVKPFEDAAFGLKPGEVSGVVETQFGYHIIKATGKDAGGTAPFDEVKGKIEEYLKGTEVQKQVVAKVEELKKSAKIEYPGQKN